MGRCIRTRFSLLLAGALAASPATYARAEERLCPGIVFVGEGSIDLTRAERRLVCGYGESDGWRTVPLNQARHFLRAFLQVRGYHRPVFRREGDSLLVDRGPRTFITGKTGEGLPPPVRLPKRRGVEGEPLTPKALDRLQSWITLSLQSHGYGCPEVRMRGDPETGIVHAQVNPGPGHIVREIRQPYLYGIDPGVFRRFDAFSLGEPLDLRLLSLTSRRIIEEDLFLSAYFDLHCSESKELTITRRIVPAKPRLVTLGIGADSEGIVRVRARWKHSRIGWRASSLQATAFASFREQSGEAFMRWYPRPAALWHLLPRVEVRREDEPRFEALFSEVSLGPAVAADVLGMRVRAQAGPSWEYTRTLRGEGPADENFFVWNARLDAMSHMYEYYLREPRTGWELGLDVSSRLRGVQSPFTAHSLRVTGRRLWNLGHYDPPAAVLGWRGLAETTLLGAGARLPDALPPSLRFFLGGDADIRGFSRKQLPIGAEGFLTTAYQGLELRAGQVLPYNLQPFLFIDAAMGGRDDLFLEPNVYWSPGLGLRWGSPVGAFRATIARGLTWRRDPALPFTEPQWQFFFSYGQEF